MTNDTYNNNLISNIVIDPRFIFNYASYYIYGINKLFNNSIIKWQPLEGINLKEYEDYRKGFPLIVQFSTGNIKKIFIDTNDKNNIHQRYYEWSDLYAKINVMPEDKNKAKILAIGPSFSIRVWDPINTIIKSLINYSKWNNSEFKASYKIMLRDYLYTIIRRKPYGNYNCECEEENDYVFSLNTLWYDEATFETTNKLRGVFSKYCKENIPRFEGGFFYIDAPGVVDQFPKYETYLTEYADLIMTKRMSMAEYSNNIRKSAFVFNTPSVCGCHGWKLGEYLAMGKAIISTPISNIMPGEFINGVHYLEASSEEDIKCCINDLYAHPEKRLFLKQNAKEYYDKYLSPEAVVTRIFEKALNS